MKISLGEVELSPNPENNNGENNVFDDIFNNEDNDSLTKSFNSELKNELNLRETKNNNKTESAVKAKKKKQSSKSNKNSSNKSLNSKGKSNKNNSLLKKKTKRNNNNQSNANSKSKAKAKASLKISSKQTSISNKNPNNSNLIENVSLNSSAEAENINAISKKEKKQNQNEEKNNRENSEKDENSSGRKLTDEECLEKMKEKLPNDKGLTKTFITRKLRKKVMITRVLDYSRFDATVKNVENSIPKKTGPNNFVKFSLKTTSEDEFKINSNLLYFIKDLFITNFIVLKSKDNVKKIVIAGSIDKDIIYFLKKIATLEFKEKYNVTSAKVKAYAFYEELVHEFTERTDVVSKNLNDDDIQGLLKQFEYLTHMRKCYEEIKKIRIAE